MIICTSVPFAAVIALSLSSGASTKIDCFVRRSLMTYALFAYGPSGPTLMTSAGMMHLR